MLDISENILIDIEWEEFLFLFEILVNYLWSGKDIKTQLKNKGYGKLPKYNYLWHCGYHFQQ